MDIPTLVKKRTLFKGKLARLQTTVNKHDSDCPIDKETAEALIEDLADIKSKVNAIQEEVAALCSTDDEIEAQVEVSEWFLQKIIHIKSKLVKIRESCNPPDDTHRSNNIKLPRMELPLFTGRHELWQSFQDLFIASVETNRALSGAQKLQYLKSCVKGEAANLIQSFAVTDENYREAWSLLVDRYDNKRESVQAIIKRLHYQQTIKSESASAIQKLLDVTNECLRSLKVLGRPVEEWDDLIVFMTVEKLDPNSRREWAITLKDSEPPTFKQLSEFLDLHIRGLNASGVHTNLQTNVKSKTFGQVSGSRQQAQTHLGTSSGSCPACKGVHQIYKCEQFKNMSVDERAAVVQSSSLCVNCLHHGHYIAQCKSKYVCKVCKKKHNSLLHFERKSTHGSSSEAANKSPDTGSDAMRSLISNHCSLSQVLLKTALVTAKDQCGLTRTLRVLLDDGSQGSFITEMCAKSLGLQLQKTDVTIRGISSSPVCSVNGQVSLTINSLVKSASVEVLALVVGKVTGMLPTQTCNQKSWAHIQGLQLADPRFYSPSKVDMLLGSDVLSSILCSGVRNGSPGEPLAQNTVFGWVLCGPVSQVKNSVIQVNHADIEINTILRKFWELEELPPIKHLNPEERLCEKHFSNNHTRDENGRFVVRLPFTPLINQLGSSRDQAVSRLFQLERRFRRFPERKQQYVQFMREYEKLHHMVKVQNCESDPANFYLPHHFVVKEDSSSTKLRVVFDGSAKSSTGVSLNNTMMVGPTIQDDLFTLLLRFRCHKIALKADIAKMYRQFKVHEDDAKFQRIVWRESPELPIQDFQLQTVTYGTASAPFLATRCLQQLAKDESNRFPVAAKILSQDMYVDDLMSGEDTIEKAVALRQELSDLVTCGGMKICKWATNDPEVLQSIPPDFRESKMSLNMDSEESLKALGVAWNPSTDQFSFTVNPSENSSPMTKRRLLSELAKVFDPLGWLAPVTVKAKIIFQDLWKEQMSWDETLSETIQLEWKNYQSEINLIKTISIPRCVIVSNVVNYQLHGFSDASEKAYAAAVYLRCESQDGSIVVNLLAAKSKVSPMKQISIPRLELCGAVLCANLLDSIKSSVRFQCSTTGWTDSTIVLKWLESFPGRWKTFVANRVAQIQELIPSSSWRHVVSEENPADLPSRGIPPVQLVSSNLWWHGPEWLASHSIPPSNPSGSIETPVLEEKKKTIAVNQNCVDVWPSLISRFSSLTRLKRVAAYCLRFINNTVPANQKRTNELTCEELASAMKKLVAAVQLSEFGGEIKSLKSSQCVPTGSRLSQLCPFIDGDEIIRVGGRLQHASLPEDRKHPIVLPHNHHFTTLMVRDSHHKNLHSGFQLTWSNIQLTYWIVRGRDTVRNILRKCVKCRRERAKVASQLMGSLPSPRVSPGRPFLHCGVDYAGPYLINQFKGRGSKKFKCYFAVFVCMGTKAIHLEAVSELSTEAFIAALKRFSSRRGIPQVLYSDCGTNFTGADKELKRLLESCKHQTNLKHFLSEKGTSWEFNPPAAPHHGGLWEAGVKSVKFHLRRVIGCSSLTIEEFQTVLCLVEACLNSRPLCAVSNDPSDLSALTPGHFLIGHPLTALPEPDLTVVKTNRLTRWQQTQKIFQHFWNRWSNEYLSSLQQRFKWKTKRENMTVGDLVLVKDELLPPMKWKLGRITEVHPGSDMCIRVVTVKTATSEYKRSIAKLCPLLSSDE